MTVCTSQSCTSSGTGVSINAPAQVAITNADQGVGVFSVFSGSAGSSLQLTLVANDAITSQYINLFTLGSGGAAPAGVNFAPALQREDGSYIGADWYGNLFAIGINGSLLWQKQVTQTPPGGGAPPAVYPLYATADGGAIVTSTPQCYASVVATGPCSSQLGTLYTLDQNGIVTSQTADTGALYSWTNQWYVDPQYGVSGVLGSLLALVGWTGGDKGNPSSTAAAINNPWFPPLPSCGSDNSCATRPGPAEFANFALFEVQKLVLDYCELCDQWVFSRLPGGSANDGEGVRKDFANWLIKLKTIPASESGLPWPYQTPGLYNGTISKAPECFLYLEQGKSCGWFKQAFGPTIASDFQDTPGASNLAKTPSHEGYVNFYNVNLWGKGTCYNTISSLAFETTGTREKAITFHEALHGYTGLMDAELANQLGIKNTNNQPFPTDGSEDSDASAAITQYIAEQVFGWPKGQGFLCTN